MGSSCETCPLTIGNIVARQAAQYANKIAIIDKSESISYGELDTKARKLSAKLLELGLVDEDPVGILAPHGTEHIIAQVAIIYAGGTCLPLDHTMSDKDIQLRFNNVEAKYLVVNDVCKTRCLYANQALSINHADEPNPGHDFTNFPRDVDPDFRSHILFTSGTTGLPKAVQVPGRGILRVANDPLCYPQAAEDRFGHINNTSFDASLLDIWVALLNGGTIVVLDRQDALNPDVFARSIKRQQVTVMFLTASLFRIIALECPTAFSSFKTLIVGGESPNLDACRVVLENGPPGRLLNGYGPTECSILAAAHEITSSDVAENSLPIGNAVNQTDLYVLDNSFQPVIGQNSGELFIGGPGVSRGYVNDLDKTRASFVSVPGLGFDKSPRLLYRTGDIVQRNDEDNLVWLGRKDREVKVRGYRVRLDAIETQLLLSGLVDNVVAMKLHPSTSESAVLVACFTSKALTGNFEMLLAEAKSRLPAYMIPQLVPFQELPINRHGKVDRQQVTMKLLDYLQQRNTKDITSSAGQWQAMNQTERRLAEIWSRILFTVPRHDIQSSSDFFRLGATSLDVASLIPDVRRAFNIQLPVWAVYQHSGLESLAAFINDKKPTTFAQHTEDVKAMLHADATGLVNSVQFPGRTPKHWLSAEEGNVFLTGATGFVGAYLLSELVQLPGVRMVRCLVREKSRQSATNRLFANLTKYRLDGICCSMQEKIHVVPGDFAEPRLGLSEAAFSELANWSSVIYHLGAQVDYNQPYTSHRQANVMGTLHILQLAFTGRPTPVHYTSSIAAFGPTGLVKNKTDIVCEDDSLTEYLEMTLPYETGYGQSQWVVDEIMTSLIRRGFPIAIYRLGFVLCNSSDGVGNPDDFVGRLLADCLRLRVYPLLPDQRKELLTVDYVASTIKWISMSRTNVGRVYHITPDVGSSIDMADLFSLAGRLRGVEMTPLSYRDWVKKLKESIDEGMSLRLKPLLPMLEETVYEERTRWEMYEGMARFGVHNTLAALEGKGDQRHLVSSALTEESLRGYVRSLVGVE